MTLERYQARIIRGQILKILKVAYPGPASLQLLELTLSDRHYQLSPTEIQGHVTYLGEKGYVSSREEDDRLLGVTRVLVKLTPQGIDLLEGSIGADPGVEL